MTQLVTSKSINGHGSREAPPVVEMSSLGLGDYPRLARLRKELLNAPPAICVERARLVTEFFKREGFDGPRPVLRQARALSYLLENLPITIFDDELVVGSTTRHRLGTVLFPEFMAQTIWPELPTIATRDHDPVTIAEEEADLLADEVFPFWRDHTVHEHVRREGDNPRCLRIAEHLVFYVLAKSNGITHVIPDYASLVSRGMDELIDEAADAERKARDEEAAELHAAVQVALGAVVGFAGRYANACEERAQDADPSRSEELHEVASILRCVPAGPARTLHEALQAIWITEVALHQENNDLALSFGRLDQFLYSYYRDDLANGRVDEKRAGELIGSFFIKMGDHTPLVPQAGQEMFGGVSTNQAVTVGGMKPDGTDGVNDLTFLMVKVSEILALREPNMCARLHEESSPEYRRVLVESIYRTGAAPALYGDEAVIDALIEHGVSLEDARDYGVIGCVETTSAGRTMGMTGAILINVASVLELALNDGVHPLSGSQIGPKTDRLSNFSSFDDVYEALEGQLESIVALATDGNARFADAHATLHPTPLLSALIEGTKNSGRDVTRGGAKYNSSGVAIIGLADLADSLTAMKKVVFEDVKVSAAQLSNAMDANFDGHEKTRALLKDKSPNYGTDESSADEMVADVIRLISKIFEKHENPRGGRYNIGYWSITMHAGFGALTGCLPNGRLKGEPLASGATPSNGVAVKGPTAAMASTAKLPAPLMANCIANNHKLSRNLFDEPGKLDLFEKLVEVYFKRGGMQVQFTVQDRQTLIDARDNPDEYRDLLVRVSGYTAYFCDLNRRMQDEIIARTEDQI